MTRTELIEKARLAYVEAWEAKKKEIGRGIAAPGTKSRAGITAALAVFEKAHAPTDDEREALADRLFIFAKSASMSDLKNGRTDALLAAVAVLRRSEVPEPHPLDALEDGTASTRRAIADAKVRERMPLMTAATAAFRLHPDPPTWEEDPVGRDTALRWHLRGFEDGLNAGRSEVPEPSADDDEFIGGEFYLEEMEGAEPQSEPTRSQINAAALELYGVSATYDPKRVAAALRAAQAAQ